MRAFILLEDVPYLPKPDCWVKRGSIVFACLQPDYGVAMGDSLVMREPYLAVTLDPTGNYPFWTVPMRLLTPAIKAN
jgi:hypothetical protein